MMYEEEILDEMNKCERSCTGLGGPSWKYDNPDWLLENLPGIDYVKSRMLNYIFSNGMTTGEGEASDKKLDAWLYNDRNRLGATNYSVLRDAVGYAIVEGACGIRMYDGDLYLVRKGYYGLLTREEDGIKETLGYFIRRDRKKVRKAIDLKDHMFRELSDIERYFDESGYILLDSSGFVNLRNDTSAEFGCSPLTRDRQRLRLILSVYNRLNYDIKYDGPGRLLLHTKDGYASGENNEVSTTELLNNDPAARYEQAREEAKRIARDIKNSSSDAVGVISGGFDKEITHLPRVTKATEFLDWLDVDMTVIAQVLGMSPTLLEIGDMHGNVSVEKIIDTAMLNTIVPLREAYSIQFSDLLAERIGVGKVFFNKYDMQQTRDENEIRNEVSLVIKNLCYANKANDNGNIQKCIDDCAAMLGSSLRDDNGDVVRLQ